MGDPSHLLDIVGYGLTLQGKIEQKRAVPLMKWMVSQAPIRCAIGA